LVSCESRVRAATSAAESGPGRLRSNSRKSSNGRPLALILGNSLLWAFKGGVLVSPNRGRARIRQPHLRLLPSRFRREGLFHMNIRDFIDDTARSVAFLSRVPVPQRHFTDHDGRLSRAVQAFPL